MGNLRVYAISYLYTASTGSWSEDQIPWYNGGFSMRLGANRLSVSTVLLVMNTLLIDQLTSIAPRDSILHIRRPALKIGRRIQSHGITGILEAVGGQSSVRTVFLANNTPLID